MGNETYRVTGFGDVIVQIQVESLRETTVQLKIDRAPSSYSFVIHGHGEVHLRRSAETFVLQDASARLSVSDAGGGGGRLTANMHGSLVEVLVTAGDRVDIGDRLAVLEAMKMQHPLLAELRSTVSEVFGDTGAQLAMGDLILVIETEDEDAGS